MKNNGNKDGKYTVAGTPPAGKRQTRSHWAGLFEECRGYEGEWRRTVRSFGRSSAAQIASDLRNTEHRDAAKMRLCGLFAGERWEAVWGRDAQGSEPQRCFIWLRYLGVPGSATPPPFEELW